MCGLRCFGLCNCRCPRKKPKKKKTVTYASLVHEVPPPAATGNPVSVENENYVPPKGLERTQSNTSKKANIQQAKRRVRQKMKLMVKPALDPQTYSDDLLTIRRAQDIWEGDTYLRILAEYEEAKAKNKATSDKALEPASKKSVKFSNEHLVPDPNKKPNVAGELRKTLPLQQVETQGPNSKEKAEAETETMSGGSTDVEIASFLIHGADEDLGAATGSCHLDEEDIIKLQCDACGTSAITNFSQLSKQKHILPFLHSAASANVEGSKKSLGVATPTDSEIRALDVDKSPADKNAREEVLEILMDKSKFPCINGKS